MRKITRIGFKGSAQLKTAVIFCEMLLKQLAAIASKPIQSWKIEICEVDEVIRGSMEFNTKLRFIGICKKQLCIY